MPLAEGQFQVGSLLMGPGTKFEMLTDVNPWVRSTRTPATGDRSWAHGTWSGAEWAAEVVIPMAVKVKGVTGNVAGWMAAHQELAAAFAAVGTGGDVELRFTLGGREYVMFGRPRMSEPDQATIGLGYSRTQCAFVCPDPLIYAGEETVVGPITPPSWVGGWSLPFTFPFTFNATLSGGEAEMVNEGTVESGLNLRIDGPCKDPVVTVTQGDSVTTLTVATTVASGDYLEIDTASRTVYYNGSTNQRGYAFEDWPLAPVGSSTVRYRSGEGAGSLTVTFRSAWW